MINALQTALSGLMASLKKTEAGASNIANITTAGRIDGNSPKPYSAQTTVQTAVSDADGQLTGVRAENIAKKTPFVPAYDPDSPFADENGVIGVPNINLAEEAVNLSLAETTYKANIKVLQTIQDMQDESLRILDKEA